MKTKREARLKRKKRIRKRVQGTQEQPRLSVFRSAKHIYAQVIDDTAGATLAAACSLEKTAKAYLEQKKAQAQTSDQAETPETSEQKKKEKSAEHQKKKGKSAEQKNDSEPKGKTAMAVAVGRLIAERATEKGIKKIVFDRNGFLYHGRIKALADSARKAGLEF